MSYFDFNSASEQTSFDPIPKGTIVPVRLMIRPGGYDDPQQGWTGGFATRNPNTGSVYLSCEFVVLEGPHARRKMWSLIGLYSAKGPEWGQMGRTFIKAILNSARNLHPGDNSPQAQNARRIHGFADLDGIEFIGKVDWEKDLNGADKAVVKSAVTPEHRDYAAIMASLGNTAATTQKAQAYAEASGRDRPQGLPTWAQ